MVDGALDDVVGGVEVAVGEPVPHSGDLGSRQVRLGGQQVYGQALDRLVAWLFLWVRLNPALTD